MSALPITIRKILRPLYYWGRQLVLSGARFECPLCGGHYRRFLKKGEPQRANAMCPGCLSLERHRLLWLFLAGEAKAERAGTGIQAARILSQASRVLHFAPEAAIEKCLRALAHIKYQTADLTPGRADEAFDITSIPYPEQSFDLILCNHVLEHVANDMAALGEMLRVLKPGGRLLIQIPLCEGPTREDLSITDPETRRILFGQEDHIRYYGLDFAERAQRAGFHVKIVWPWRGFSPELREKYRLAPDHEEGEPIFICQKSG